MTDQEREELAHNKAERMVEHRQAIFEAIPEECDEEEMTIAGLSIFLQAALHMADNDPDKVNDIIGSVLELAKKMNSSIEEDEKSTVH
jgi:hypothetical protein